MIVSEKEMIEILNKAKNVLLLEPNYKRQYPPIGLAKISSFLKKNNAKVEYSRDCLTKNYDLICITTLFTTDSLIVINTIKNIRRSFFTKDIPILIGGIFASLMSDYIEKICKNLFIFKGYSKILDLEIPDYSIDYNLSYPWNNASVTFTTRGCPNKCGYCMVWKMEPEFYIEKKWKESILNNNKQIALISDNNFLAAPMNHIEEVCGLLKETNKKVIFNNAVDVKLLNNENANYLSKINYMKNGRPGLRFAFDRMQDDGHYQKACELMIKKMRLKSLSGIGLTYILFNFIDTPQEAYYRAKQCWKYKSAPYLMQYRPLDLLNKSTKYIGKYWTYNLIKAFRLWGETYGYNTGDKTFESWINNNKSKIKLNEEDWEKWRKK